MEKSPTHGPTVGPKRAKTTALRSLAPGVVGGFVVVLLEVEGYREGVDG